MNLMRSFLFYLLYVLTNFLLKLSSSCTVVENKFSLMVSSLWEERIWIRELKLFRKRKIPLLVSTLHSIVALCRKVTQSLLTVGRCVLKMCMIDHGNHQCISAVFAVLLCCTNITSTFTKLENYCL